MGKGSHTISTNKKIENNHNHFRVLRNTNNMREDQSFNMFNKMMNDNNNNSNNNYKKYINSSHSNSINKMMKTFYNDKQNSKTIVYSSNTKTKTRKKKFNIYDILNEEEPNEENDKKKIIVGLKDVKIISNSNIEKKENKNNKTKNLINIHHNNDKNQNNIYNINNDNNNNYYYKNKNKKNENNNCIINDESEASTIRIENPSLSILRSTDFTKRIFPFNMSDKRKKLLKNNNEYDNNNEKEKNINKVYKKKIINHSTCLLNTIDDSINRDNANLSLSSMNKLFKHFNKIKDIVNELNNFNDFITFIADYISKDVDLRKLLLRKILLNDYNLLLNQITYNFNQSSCHNIITFLEYSKKISIYNTNLNEFKTKNFEKILPQIKTLDKSMSIDFDDNDLIFISGGIENSKYNCSNIFIILRWSTEIIEYKGSLPERKAYHSTLYFNNNFYIIGGIGSNKKVSKECQFFSLKNKKWHDLPNLNVGRANSSICIYNNKYLYVFRGRDDKNVLDSIEYIKLLNIRSTWKIFKPLDYGYVWNAAENSLVITIGEGKILICGGEDNEGNLCNDTFLLEIKTKQIFKGIDMIIPCSFKNHGGFNQGKYYCVDIKSENNNINYLGFGNVHIFDAIENIWTIK